ncbi:MAG: DUF1638 domain-containing protein [Anaerolineae bacterium]|nr:DUF1638 domain-containing protein [Anaerolineae bacterium]
MTSHLVTGVTREEGVLRLKCLACDALARPVYYCAALTPHIVDVALHPLGLHNDPAKLRLQLQAEIDATGADMYDAIILAYGLCGKATAGLRSRSLPLVMPRAHDCITLFLGSRERYAREFNANPGTYWYVQDYVQRNPQGGIALSLGTGLDTDLDAVYATYVAKYGKDNADYLMDVMGAWQQHYDRAVFIGLGIGDEDAVRTATQAEARQRGWRFDALAGDLVLIRRLLEGDWDADFLQVAPGQQVVMRYDETIVDCETVL